MDWENWFITAIVVLCIFAIVTSEPSERKCSVIHENASHLQKCEIW